MKSAHPDTLIIGYGNSLCGDDAAGLYAADRLAALGYETIRTHQLTPELAERIAAAEHVIFVDCDVTLPPGELSISAVGPAESDLLEHHAAPASLLRLARDLYGHTPQAHAVGIGPEALDFGRPLSGPVKSAIRQLRTLLITASCPASSE